MTHDEIMHQIEADKHICKIVYNGRVIHDFIENKCHYTGIQRMILQPCLEGHCAIPLPTVAFLPDFQEQAYSYYECYGLAFCETMAHVRYVSTDEMFDPTDPKDAVIHELFGPVEISEKIDWDDYDCERCYCIEQFKVGDEDLMKLLPYCSYLYIEIDLYNR